MTATNLARAILLKGRLLACTLAFSLQGGAGNSKLLNSTLELHDLSAHSLDSQLQVGTIPGLVASLSFVRTHEGISVTEPVKKLLR